MNKKKVIKVRDNDDQYYVSVLDNKDIKSCIIKKDLKGIDYLTFTMLKDNKANTINKFNTIEKGQILELEEDGYIQKYRINNLIKRRQSGIIFKEVIAEQISYDLIDEPIEYLPEFIGSLSSFFSMIFSGGYTYSIENDIDIQIKEQNETNKRKLIIEAIGLSGQDFYFYNKHLKVGNTFGKDEGSYITINKNLKDFTSEIDEDNNIFYSVNFLELFNSDDFKEQGIDLDKLDIGDFVIINDPEMDLKNEKLKVLYYEYNYLNKMMSSIELSNRKLKITDIQITRDNLKSEVGKEVEEAFEDFTPLGTEKALSIVDKLEEPEMVLKCLEGNIKEFAFLLNELKKMGIYFSKDEVNIYTEEKELNILKAKEGESFVDSLLKLSETHASLLTYNGAEWGGIEADKQKVKVLNIEAPEGGGHLVNVFWGTSEPDEAIKSNMKKGDIYIQIEE